MTNYERLLETRNFLEEMHKKSHSLETERENLNILDTNAPIEKLLKLNKEIQRVDHIIYCLIEINGYLEMECLK